MDRGRRRLTDSLGHNGGMSADQLELLVRRANGVTCRALEARYDSFTRGQHGTRTRRGGVFFKAKIRGAGGLVSAALGVPIGGGPDLWVVRCGAVRAETTSVGRSPYHTNTSAIAGRRPAVQLTAFVFAPSTSSWDHPSLRSGGLPVDDRSKARIAAFGWPHAIRNATASSLWQPPSTSVLSDWPPILFWRQTTPPSVAFSADGTARPHLWQFGSLELATK